MELEKSTEKVESDQLPLRALVKDVFSEFLDNTTLLGMENIKKKVII